MAIKTNQTTNEALIRKKFCFTETSINGKLMEKRAKVDSTEGVVLPNSIVNSFCHSYGFNYSSAPLCARPSLLIV